MESSERKPKFDAIFSLAEKATEDEELDPRHLWPTVFPKLFGKAIELDRPALLRSLLELAHDSMPPKLQQEKVRANDASLLRACEADSYDLVKPFLLRGYRLKLGDFSRGHEAEHCQQSQYSSLAEKRRNKKGVISRGDQVRKLYVLRQMAKPSYILGCYQVVCEEKYEKMDQTVDFYCECNSKVCH